MGVVLSLACILLSHSLLVFPLTCCNVGHENLTQEQQLVFRCSGNCTEHFVLRPNFPGEYTTRDALE